VTETGAMLPSLNPRASLAVLAAAAALGAGCAGSTVNLGQATPHPYHFSDVHLVSELGTQASDNPTLTSDLLEIFFTSNRDNASTDIWTARRASPADLFGAVTLVSEASSPSSFETSSAISSDGLTLWFGSDRLGGLGGLDIWVTQRSSRDAAWSVPVDLTGLNSPAFDLPRPPGLHGLVMPLSSERSSAVYWTYFSARATEADAFGALTPIPELSFTDQSTVDAFLTDDGLTLFYSSSPPEGAGDLFVAWRRTTSDPFTLSVPLDDLNTPTHAERDPWLSPDGQTFFFTSDRGGLLQIYQASAKQQ
jgi:WD40 repeat protein